MKTNLLHPLWLLLCGSLYTSFAPLAGALTITVQPQDQTVVEHRRAVFAVEASPPGSLTYAWFRWEDAAMAFVAIPNATGPQYEIVSATLADHGSRFRVAVKKGSASPIYSQTATLTVVVDTVPPALVSAMVACNLTDLLLRFDEPVDPNTAADPANYGVLDGSGMAMPVTASLLSDGQTVCLTLNSALAGSTIVEVNGVTDLAATPNVMIPVACMAYTVLDALGLLYQQVQEAYDHQPSHGGLINGADAQLYQVLDKLTHGNLTGAIGQLQAFINSNSQATTLIAVAQTILDLLKSC